MKRAKKKPEQPEQPALYEPRDLVSKEQLDRIPDYAERFIVPVRPLTLRIILKPRGKDPNDDNYFGAEIFAELRHGLNIETQTCSISRSWLLKAEHYLGPATKNKGGMQRDLTLIWSDFRPYCEKVKDEEAKAKR